MIPLSLLTNALTNPRQMGEDESDAPASRSAKPRRARSSSSNRADSFPRIRVMKNKPRNTAPSGTPSPQPPSRLPSAMPTTNATSAIAKSAFVSFFMPEPNSQVSEDSPAPTARREPAGLASVSRNPSTTLPRCQRCPRKHAQKTSCLHPEVLSDWPRLMAWAPSRGRRASSTGDPSR